MKKCNSVVIRTHRHINKVVGSFTWRTRKLYIPSPVLWVQMSLSLRLALALQVQWNEPGAQYSLVEKEKLPRFPFSIDQEGNIYVTQPLDREEKDSVSKTGRSFTGDKTKSCTHGELRAEKILLKNSNKNPQTGF